MKIEPTLWTFDEMLQSKELQIMHDLNVYRNCLKQCKNDKFYYRELGNFDICKRCCDEAELTKTKIKLLESELENVRNEQNENEKLYKVLRK